VEQLSERYDAIVLAAGMGSVPNLGIDGEELEGVYDAIEYVEGTKTDVPPFAIQGAHVAVIGAGNTAIDAATCSVRLGASNVKMIYRRTKEEMTAYEFEYEFAKQEGVEFSWLTAPKRIIGDSSGRVTHLECVRMELSDLRGKDGRRIPEPVEGSEFLYPVDAVILAIGQKRHLGLIEQLGLEHNRGVVLIDEVTRRTSNPQIYAAGDIIFGAGQGEAMVVSAAEQGKQTAYAISRFFAEKQNTVAI
jgi:dihydropyrimidine dehydrogenase (NAD+) subunit PreT